MLSRDLSWTCILGSWFDCELLPNFTFYYCLRTLADSGLLSFNVKTIPRKTGLLLLKNLSCQKHRELCGCVYIFAHI